MSQTQETRTPTYILGEDIKPGDTLLRSGEHFLIYDIEHEMRAFPGDRSVYAKQHGQKWVKAWCTRTVTDYRGVSTFENVTLSFLASAEFHELYNHSGVRALRDQWGIT